MRTSLSALALLAFAAQDPQEVRVQVRTKDGSSFQGTAKLPASLTVKTKYGDAKVDLNTVTSLSRAADGTWSVQTNTGNAMSGKMALGSLEVQTSNGKMTIPEEDLQSIQLQGRTPNTTPNRNDTVSKREPKFKGYPIRKSSEKGYLRFMDPAILLADGKRAALLDCETDECVVVELASGACTRIKVESSPACLLEKSGKIYVANSKSNSLTILDAKTLKAIGRIATSASPTWLSTPALGDALYVAACDRVLVVDTRTDKSAEPLLEAPSGRMMTATVAFVTATPDNRILYTQIPQGYSPSMRPEPFRLSAGRATRSAFTDVAGRHTDHPCPLVVDLPGARVYAGYFVYSLDLEEKLADLPCFFAVPHPTKSLVFGVKRTNNRLGGSDTVVVFEEDKLSPLAEIPMGDDVRALLPTEKFLYVVGAESMYPVELSGRIPADSLAKARIRRIPVDPSRLPTATDIKKAEGLLTEGEKLLAAGKTAEARRSFEAAQAADPLSSANAEIGMALVREKKYDEAIAFLSPLRRYPFRSDMSLLSVYDQLGIAYGSKSRNEEAIKTFQEGLRIAPKDPLLLKNLGVAYSNSGKLSSAYVCWKKCLDADPKQEDVKKMLSEILREIRKATTRKCEACNGKGRHEVIIEEEDKTRKKIIQECRTCEGTGKTWAEPCLACSATGKASYYDYCQKCYGEGVILHGLKTADY